jgi:hypothetical protein
MKRTLSFLALAMIGFASPVRAADEFSGADKLRAIYSAEFRFTKQGVPVVSVAIAEGLSRVSISVGAAGGLAIAPRGRRGP